MNLRKPPLDPDRPSHLPRVLALSSTVAILCATGFLLFLQSGCGTVDAPPAAAMSVTLETATTAVEPSKWNGWRGGDSGAVATGMAPAQWGTADTQWSVDVPGTGNSSPVVWGEHIFLTTQENDELSLLSYSRRGDLQWRQTLASTSRSTHQRNGHASASVATNGDVVIAKLGNALHALTLDGVQLWSVTLPDENHKWGAASSPVICGNAVIQLCDSQGASELASYALSDGSLFWRTPIVSDGSWSTPLIVPDESSRPTSIVINGTGSNNGAPGRVLSFDVLTGQSNWAISGTSDIPCPTALVAGDRIISATGTNGPILAIEHATGNVLWRKPAGGAQVPTGVVIRDDLFLISDHGMVTCRDIDNGKVLWQHRLSGKFSSSLVATAQHIYAVNERGKVFTFAASTAKFELLGESDLAETCLATPAIVDDQLLFRTATRLVCVGPRHAITMQREAEQREQELVSSPTDRQTPTAPPTELIDQPRGSGSSAAFVGEDTYEAAQ